MPLITYVNKKFRSEALAKIQIANAIIEEYAAQGFKLTLRQLYYQFVARDIIPNNQKSYNNLGCLVNDARLAGMIDWDAIEDRTRNLRSRTHWESPSEILEAVSQQFSMNLWEEQENYVEVWIEKDALVGVISRICTSLDVAYFACRGYTSQSEMWSAAQRMRQKRSEGKICHLIHLGDHDPSGIDMTRDIEDRFTMFRADVHVNRIALNYSQVEEYNPPPNFAKSSDSRFANYLNEYGESSWELDALEPRIIVNLVEDAIRELMAVDLWADAVARQVRYRRQLRHVADHWDRAIRGFVDTEEEEEE